VKKEVSGEESQHEHKELNNQDSTRFGAGAFYQARLL